MSHLQTVLPSKQAAASPCTTSQTMWLRIGDHALSLETHRSAPGESSRRHFVPSLRMVATSEQAAAESCTYHQAIQ